MRWWWSGAGDPEDNEQRSDSEELGQGASEEQERDRIGPLRTRDMIPGDPHTFSVMITEPWAPGTGGCG